MKVDRKRVAAGPEHRPRGRTVDERPRHIGRGVQLRGARAAPYVMFAGLDQVTTGVAFKTLIYAVAAAAL